MAYRWLCRVLSAIIILERLVVDKSTYSITNPKLVLYYGIIPLLNVRTRLGRNREDRIKSCPVVSFMLTTFMLVAGVGVNPQDLTCTAILYWHRHLDNLYATRMIRLNGIHYKRIAIGCRRSLFTSGHRCSRYILNSSTNNFFLRSRHRHTFISH